MHRRKPEYFTAIQNRNIFPINIPVIMNNSKIFQFLEYLHDVRNQLTKIVIHNTFHNYTETHKAIKTISQVDKNIKFRKKYSDEQRKKIVQELTLYGFNEHLDLNDMSTSSSGIDNILHEINHFHNQ